jgi:hypothetical protein
MGISISQHAADRAAERRLDADLNVLWQSGRAATWGDCRQFGVGKYNGFAYRVAIFDHRTYLLVLDEQHQILVTVIRKVRCR